MADKYPGQISPETSVAYMVVVFKCIVKIFEYRRMAKRMYAPDNSCGDRRSKRVSIINTS